MSARDNVLRLTTAQAIVRWLENQYIEIDGTRMRLFGGGMGIFGHGNVTCLGEALYNARETLPLYRGQNEQGMGFYALSHGGFSFFRVIAQKTTILIWRTFSNGLSLK